MPPSAPSCGLCKSSLSKCLLELGQIKTAPYQPPNHLIIWSMTATTPSIPTIAAPLFTRRCERLPGFVFSTMRSRRLSIRSSVSATRRRRSRSVSSTSKSIPPIGPQGKIPGQTSTEPPSMRGRPLADFAGQIYGPLPA